MSGFENRYVFSLRKNCPYSELFGSVFSCIQTGYGEILVSRRIQSKWGKIRKRTTPNTDTFHTVSEYALSFFIKKIFKERKTFRTDKILENPELNINEIDKGFFLSMTYPEDFRHPFLAAKLSKILMLKIKHLATSIFFSQIFVPS